MNPLLTYMPSARIRVATAALLRAWKHAEYTELWLQFEPATNDDLMDEVASMYEREVEYELKTLSAKIEPILLIGLGIMLLILALGIFL